MRKQLLILSFFLLAIFAKAQETNIIDQVIWVVGDEAILLSEVEEERLRMQYEGVQVPGDPYCVIPEQIAIQRLFLHQAELDSIYANESTVNHQVDMRMNYYISQIGSKEKLEEYFRKPASQIREEMVEQVTNQMVIQQMRAKLTENIKPTPAEIERYYKTIPQDSLPTIPIQVEVQILSFVPPVPESEKERIKRQLREFTERVNSGQADFAMLARLYSEDTESAKRGGELGFVGRGQLVSEFADVAFNLNDPRRVSKIVETEYGYHIIQLIEKKGDRINCRHILLKPRISSDDRTKALEQLESIRDTIIDGKGTFEEAVVFFSQDKNTSKNAGNMINLNTNSTKFEYKDLPSEVAKQIYSLKVGEISKPFTMIDETKNKEVCAIVKLKSQVPAHKADLEHDFQVIKQMLENQLSEELIEKWIIQKQKEIYVHIEPSWTGCEFQYPGWGL